MVEQAELLEHDADVAAHLEEAVLFRARWTSWPNMVARPRLGFSDSSRSLSSEVLPEPDGPVRKWNEPGSMRKVEVSQDLRAVAVAAGRHGELDHAVMCSESVDFAP